MALLFSTEVLSADSDLLFTAALDFNVAPFDYSTSPFPFFPSPAFSTAPPSSSIKGATAAALDQSLESPLGLESGLYADFLVSPMFSEASDTVPELDGPLDYDYAFPSLFPTSSAPTAFETALRPNPPPPKRPSRSPSTTSSSCSTPAPVTRPTKALPKPNGFRAGATKTPLLPIDAPIEPRAYLLPSTTSRKRKTTAAEREIAKRLALAEASAAPAPDIPEDLVAAVEKKRLLNTLCARKSRQRKQERLGELEVENSALVEENDVLKKRVAELEALLTSSGAQF